MNPSDQALSKKLAFGVLGIVIVLLAGIVFAALQWRSHVRAQGERLVKERCAVEEHIALSKKEQNEIILKITEFKERTRNETGRRPTDDEGPIPGYKTQIRGFYERISADKEQLRKIDRELSRLAGK